MVTTPTPLPTATPIPIPIGRPDRIAIPSIQVDSEVQPVYAQQSQIGDQWFRNWQTASYAVGYHESSALLGQVGNTVLSGHNNIKGSVFQNLYQLEPGAIIQVYADGFRYDYVIRDRFIVREAGVSLEQRLQNASWIQPTIDERLTLVSCWPPEGNAYRVIIVAMPANREQQQAFDAPDGQGG